MPADFTPHVSSFAEPLVPPPPLVMLLQETDLPYRRFQRLIISEDLPLQNIRFHPYHPFRKPPVLVRNRLTGSSKNASALPVNDDELELSDLTSLSPSPNPSRAPSLVAKREPVSKTRIERPAGAGRIPFGKLVDWDDHLINSIKDALKTLSQAHLEAGLCITLQDKDKIVKVRQAMLEKFSILDDYKSMWPLDILLGRQLKYAHDKSQSKRKQ